MTIATCTPTTYLPGHDQGEPSLATPGSAGYDLPVILTRACKTVAGKRFFTWKGHRHDAWKMPPTPKEPRQEFDHVVQWLQAVKPDEVEKIRGLQQFPSQHLHLKVPAGQTVLVPLGIATAIRHDLLCLLFPRASSALKQYRLGNCVGVIDSDYRDEWFAAVRNAGTEPLVIQHGQRIVQAVFATRVVSTWPKSSPLPETNRGGGFGSTDQTDSPQPARIGDPALESLTCELSPDEAAGLAKQAGVTTAELEAAAVDAAIASVDVSDPAPEVAPSVTGEDALPVNLVCGNIMVGPVAKFRPQTHGTLFRDKGVDSVSGVLMRELQILAPKAIPKLVEAVMANSVGGMQE